MNKKINKTFFIVALVLVLGGCSGGGGGGGGGVGPGPGPSGDSLEKSLNDLGVDTTLSKRLDNTGTALPDSWSPMGATRSVTKIDELFFVGIDVNNLSEAVEAQSLVEYQGRVFPLSTLYSPPDTRWAKSVIRAGTAGDIDGDGKEEVLTVYRSPEDNLIRLRMIDDKAEAYKEMEWIISDLDATELEITSGDYDGDMNADIVIGVSQSDGVSLLFLKGSKNNGYSVDRNQTKEITASVSGTHIVLVMKSGNIDYDAPDELAMTMNEYTPGFFGGTSGYSDGNVRYFVYDDAATGFTQVLGGFVEARIDSTLYTTKAASVALGDIDADGVDEIILGGLREFTKDCESSQYLLIAIDDRAHDLAPISAIIDSAAGAGGCETSVNPRSVIFPYVNALDIDGDQVDEIHINETIYDDFRENSWETLAAIPRNAFSHNGGNRGFAFRKNTTALAVGDVIGDGRDDIIFQMPLFGEVSVWGFEKGTELFKQKYARPSGMARNSDSTNPKAGKEKRPLIVTANVDDDSLFVEMMEYKLVFSEPIIIAALAGPPCGRDIAQNTSECLTSYGTSESNTDSKEAAVTLSASGHVGAKGGFELPIIKVGVEVEFEKTVTASVSAAVQGAYTVTKSETFFQDPMQDTVVITTIPYDQYTYRVVHHPSAEAVDKEFVLSVPREPRTFQVERNFYNESVLGVENRIEFSVFSHTIGKPASYVSQTSKNALLGRFGGFEVGPKDVDLAGGRSATIDVSKEFGASRTLAVGYEKSMKVTTGGVMGGFSVGIEASATLGYSIGSSTTYSGTVGAINPEAAEFDQDNFYKWGLMAYTQDDHESGQEFQVINYWVE